MYMLRVLLIIAILYYAFFRESKVEKIVIPEPSIVVIEKDIEIKKSRDYATETLPDATRPKGVDAFSTIIAKTNNPFLGDGRITDAHETTHMIHAELRNSRVLNGLVGLPASFYIFPDRVYNTVQPKFKKMQIGNYVPQSLRFSRFDLYIRNQKNWAEDPLYIIDEHISYVNGAIVAIEDKSRGINTDSVDPVEGPLEFSVYTVATCLAIQDLDPEFWENEDFQNFIYNLIKKSEEIFKAGRAVYPFERQESILRALQTSSDSEPIREFLRKYCDGFFLSIPAS